MKPHISLITLGVKDLQKSTRFYRDGLGLPADEMEGIIFFKTSGCWLSLYSSEALAKDANVPALRGTGFPGFTLAHNVISIEQVNALIEAARVAGATITDEPHKREWGGYSGYFQDPDGYLWEIAFNPFSPEIAVDEGGT